MKLRLFLALLAWISLAVSHLRAAEPDQAGLDFFEEKIRPVLVERCYKCHSAQAKEIESGLRLDTREATRRGGDMGHAVVPGKPGESLLVSAIRQDGDLAMPPDEKLPDDVIANFVRWVEMGAPDPREGPSRAETAAALRQQAQQHWAFRPPARPPLPSSNSASLANPIDALVAAQHVQRGLAVAPLAPRHVLLRRVYLDLVGIPPTADETAAFEADAAPDAYERVVDRLLASPLHGQRWGRHWMDVWRYSDWYGWNAEVRNSQKHIWHWRDWIVDSINADKPYDRMVQEMIAGDELAPSDADAVRATGFLARNWYRYDRHLWLANTVEHTGKAFLGLTLNCARCHDHKFDPISQVEYYQFRAIFEAHDVRVDPLPGQPDVEQDGIPRVYDGRPGEATYRFVRGNEKQPDKEHPLSASLPAALHAAEMTLQSVELPRGAYLPNLAAHHQQDLLGRAEGEVRAAGEKLRAAKEQFSKAEQSGDAGQLGAAKAAVELARREAELAAARREALAAAIAADSARYAAPPAANAGELAGAAACREKQVEMARLRREMAAVEQTLERLRREKKPQAEIDAQQKQFDEHKSKLVAAEQAVQSPGESYTSTVKEYPKTSTGRRLALARWITDRQNPLAARVAVNHIWARHFGRPLVGSVFNFGRNGQPPTHPELLDYLAVELMDSGWSMKKLHKLIVTSAAYRRQSSGGSDSQASVAADPDNRLLWRQNLRRMDAETVRDSLLAVAGRLDARLGGASLDEKTALSTTRRSLYYRHTPQDRAKFLELFDGANPEACYLRNESVMPQQALALLNSPLAREQARFTAQRLGSRSDGEFVAAAFRAVLGREPNQAEKEACGAFLREQPSLSREHVRASLVHTLFNHNDFVTIR